MCGIVGYSGPRTSIDVLIDGLSKLEYRGYDSAGVAYVEDGTVKVVKATGRLQALADKLEALGEVNSHCGIGHTRWATHGAPSDVNAHPHSGGRVSLVHNGIIENYLKIKDFLLEHGYTFESQTDTEVLVKLMDYNYNGNPLETIVKTLSQIRGSYGLAIVFADCPNKIFGVRKESPLIAAYGEGENFLASDVPAIIKYTRKYSILEENEIVEVSDAGVTFYNNFGVEIKKDILTADWNIEAAEKGGYPHFMLKEIYEQPEAIAKTVNPRIEGDLPVLGVDGLTDDILAKIKTVHIVACGTAMYAGMVGKAVIERLNRIPVQVDIASEFRYRDPILDKDDLVVIVSQSGETLDTLAALKLAKSRGVKTLAIVNVVGSSIAREADYVLYTWAGPEIAVASTKAYSVQLAALYLFAIKLGLVKGALDIAAAKKYTAALKNVPTILAEVLKCTDDVQYLASVMMNSTDMFFMGRGFDYPMTLEGSLKLKEISYVHAEAYAAGELKHGTISLITEGTPVVIIATQDELLEKVTSNVKEVKARGAHTIVICKEGANVPDDVADHVIILPDYESVLMPMLSIIPLQLFAYYMAVLRGCDVDKPRNLAKSVTVE